MKVPFGPVRLGRRPEGVVGGRTRCHLGGDWTTESGDEEILDRAHQESRALITLDKDFGELAIGRGRPQSGIVRLVDLPTSGQGRHSVAVPAKHGKELDSGAIITREAARLRVRPATEAGQSQDWPSGEGRPGLAVTVRLVSLRSLQRQSP